MSGCLFRCAPVVFVLGLLFRTAPAASAQKPVAPDAGCMLHKDTYTCNWPSFQQAFDRAHTVALQTGHLARSPAAQLRKLITELGKTEAPEGQPADLTFAVAPVDPNGVDFGPMDHDLARLKVYAAGTSSAHGTLLWAETYRGQGDRPWPAEVHALLTQFQDRFQHPSK